MRCATVTKLSLTHIPFDEVSEYPNLHNCFSDEEITAQLATNYVKIEMLSKPAYPLVSWRSRSTVLPL